MASTCLLSLVIVASGSAGDRPALRHASRAQLAQGQGAGWLSALTEAPGWAQHDYANLVALPVLSGLTFAALRTERAHLPLATLLLAYMALDALWMVVQPSVVKAPAVLLWHHAVAASLILHALVHPPHRRYVPWMSVVELNTFFLVLRRHLRRRWVEACFVLSWVVIRVCWFPYLPLHFMCLVPEPWPAGTHGVLAHLGVTAGVLGLAVLQLVWTKQQLGSAMRRWRAAREDRADGGAQPAWL